MVLSRTAVFVLSTVVVFSQTRLNGPVTIPIPSGVATTNGLTLEQSGATRRNSQRLTFITTDGSGVRQEAFIQVSAGQVMQIGTGAAGIGGATRQINWSGTAFFPTSTADLTGWNLMQGTSLQISGITGLTQCLQVNASGLVSGTGSVCGGGGGSPFSDATSLVYNSGDPTKLLRFDLSGFTSGATRVISFKNGNYVPAGENTVNTYTFNQTFAADILASGTRNVGVAAGPFDKSFTTTVYGTSTKTCQTGTTFGTCWSLDIPSSTQLRLLNTGGTQFALFDQGTSTSTFSSALLPVANNSYDVGSTSLRWKNGWFAGTGFFNGVEIASSLQLIGITGSTQCLNVDSIGLVSGTGSACGSGGSGDLTEVTATSPITVTSGTGPIPNILCTTCITTAGGQTISGSLNIGSLLIGGTSIINSSVQWDNNLTPSSPGSFSLGDSSHPWSTATVGTQYVIWDGSFTRFSASGGSVNGRNSAGTLQWSLSTTAGGLFLNGMAGGGGTVVACVDGSGNFVRGASNTAC